MKRNCESNDTTVRRPWLDGRRPVLFLITVLLFAPFAFLSVDLHHDGVMLKPAMDVAAGLVVYRDSFNQYGFFTTFLQAAAVKLFGGELLAIKLLTVVFYGLCAVELDRLWSRFLSTPFRWLTLALYWGLASFYLVPMHPWSSVYALFFLLSAATLTVRYLDGGDRRVLFGAGVAAGLAFGCRQPCGFVLVLAAVITLALEAWCRRLAFRALFRNLGIWFGGALCVPLFLAAYLTVYGAWPDYLRQNFLYVARFGWERGGSGSSATLLETFFPANGFVVFPLLSLGVFFFCCRELLLRRGVRRYLPLAAAVLAGLASWHQFYPVPCVRHLFWASVPMFGAAAWVAERIWRSRWKGRWKSALRIALLAAILLPPGVEIGIRISRGAQRLIEARNRVFCDIPGLRGVLMFPPELYYYRNLRAAFGRIPEQFRERGYLNLTPDSLFCRFFPERPPVHPMYVNWENQVYPDYFTFMMEFVRENRPVILSRSPAPFPGYRPVGGFPSVKPVYYLSVPPF